MYYAQTDLARLATHSPGAWLANNEHVQLPTPPRELDVDGDQRSDVADADLSAGPSRGSAEPHLDVSTTFFPNAGLDTVAPEDTVLVTADGVCFFVHAHKLLSASTNGFCSVLPVPASTQGSFWVPEPSAVLNILLHAVYQIPLSQYKPSLAELIAAVDVFSVYGLSLDTAIVPGAPLYESLMTQALVYPLDIYALAASHELEELASACSNYLLSLSLATLTDEQVERIGAKYLKRLFFLHLGRVDALKRLLVQPPSLHTPKDGCDFSQQTGVLRAWALASAYLSWHARPDMPSSTLSSAFLSLENDLPCEACKSALRSRVKTLVIQWAGIKATI